MAAKYHPQNPSTMEPKLDGRGMVRDLPFAIRFNVCMLLNNPHIDNNYKFLAGEMGYGISAIKTFGMKENPTDILLQDWGTKRDSTNGRLIEYLNRGGRNDVIDALYGRESCSKNEKPYKEVKPMWLPMVRDMEYKLRLSICLEMNLPQAINGNDYRMFADKVGLSQSERIEISRKENPDPMDEVLTCWGAKNEATVARMKEILLEMGREDVWEKLETDSEATLCQSLHNKAVV